MRSATRLDRLIGIEVNNLFQQVGKVGSLPEMLRSCARLAELLNELEQATSAERRFQIVTSGALRA